MRLDRFGPCMCGATDCPSCGPAQGYEVVKYWYKGRWRYCNPEDLPEEAGELEDDPRDWEDAGDRT